MRISHRAPGSAAILLTVVALLSACSGSDGQTLSSVGVSTLGSATSTPAASPTSSRPSSSPSVVGDPSPASTLPATLPAGLTAADVAAGLTSATFSNSGGGTLITVPGTAQAASRKGARVRIEVQVEKGLDVDRQKFAAFVMATLNDPRSWGHGGTRHFDRVDGAYDIRVVLASPTTSASMCRPLITHGKLSCHEGDAAVMTMYRWEKAIPGYGSDRTGYRHYLVNHEVGHALGHHHEYCSGKGRLAPVMQQQTKGLQGCAPNAWPFP